MRKNFISNFVKFCSLYNIKPMITPFTYESYYRIQNKGVKFIKIASYDCSSLNFLERIKSLKLPMVVSTGATKKNEFNSTKSHQYGFDPKISPTS